jgi:hypothetical protein
MALLRFASLVVLTLWVGGLAALGFVAAPAIFMAMEGLDPETGRVVAGEVFGVVFRRFQFVAWGLGGCLLALYALRALLGPRPRRIGLRAWLAATMLGLSLAGTLVIAPRIDAIRRGVTGPVAALPDTDARKGEFGWLHGASTGLMMATLLAGLGLIWAEMKDPH